jgi:hypothetical protein
MGHFFLFKIFSKRLIVTISCLLRPSKGTKNIWLGKQIETKHVNKDAFT